MWRPDSELQALLREPAFVRFNRALGRCNIHLVDRTYYTCIGNYRQRVSTGEGDTLLAAIVDGLPDGSDPWRTTPSLAARAALLEMLL